MTNRLFVNNANSAFYLLMRISICCLLPILLLLSSCSTVGNFLSPTEEFDYSVKAGDSLYLIAQRFDVSQSELQHRNRVSDPRKLYVGQILKVPLRDSQNQKVYGGPYLSAESARKQRANLSLPSTRSAGIKMRMPIMNGKIASRFGYRGSRFHEGVDILAERGEPIYAAHDGIVIFSGQKLSGYGNMIVIKQGEVLSVYAHNSFNSVRRGDSVKAGMQIGEVGATGRATGPHLHFEVRVRGSDDRYYAVEPMDFLKRG